MNAGSIEVNFYTCGTVDGYRRGAVHYPPGFFKVITPKAFATWYISSHDHRQVGQSGKNGDSPKETIASSSRRN